MKAERVTLFEAKLSDIRDQLEQMPIPDDPEERELFVEALWYAVEIGTHVRMVQQLSLEQSEASNSSIALRMTASPSSSPTIPRMPRFGSIH